MKNFLLLLVAALCLLSCKKKEADKPNYTIEGTLYDDTGENIVAGSTLALSVVGRGGLTRSPDNDFYQTSTTDAKGRFSFTYKELDVNSASKFMHVLFLFPVVFCQSLFLQLTQYQQYRNHIW